MDSSFSVDGGAGDTSNYLALLSKLSPQDQRELQTVMQHESQKSQIQSTIHSLTERCFTRCMSTNSGSSSGKLTSKEEACMSNCVERFMDTSTAVLRHLEKLRGR